MKTFILIRQQDETGVSGTGKVLEAVLFGNGMVVVHWLHHRHESINVYKCYDDFLEIHVKSHPGNGSKVIWSTGEIQEFDKPIEEIKQ